MVFILKFRTESVFPTWNLGVLYPSRLNLDSYNQWQCIISWIKIMSTFSHTKVYNMIQ